VRIDPARGAVAARVAVGGRPTGIAVDGSGTVWVGNLDGWVTRIDPATNAVLGKVAVPSGISAPLVARGLVWLGLQNGTLVSVDPGSAMLTGRPVSVAQDVDAIVDTPSGLWVSTFAGTAALVDPDARSVKRRIPLPGRGSGVAFAGGRVWVSDYDHRTVLGLDPASGTILAAVHTGGQPRESIVAGGVLWVCDQADGTVTPIPVG
jgi:streptogramin lyase